MNTTSQNGINLICKFEGLRLESYKCAAGVWTIGYGHTGNDVRSGMKISKDEALKLLQNDLKRFETAVNNLSFQTNQNEFDALVSFTFNCGEANLKTLVKNRTKKQIADALLMYNKAAGKVLEGLNMRRKIERELFLTPVKTQTATNPSTSSFCGTVSQQVKNLPYLVKTKVRLNIRTAPSITSPVVRVADKGEKLTVWAVQTSDNKKWGKNGKEWFCLNYCEETK